VICQVEGCTEHYGCQLRAKNIGLSSSATPTRVKDRPHKFRPMKQPSWEKGIEGTHRPGGYFMPFLNDKGARMGVHEAQSNRSRIDATKRRNASTTHVLED
jgi:hypothetical protein